MRSTMSLEQIPVIHQVLTDKSILARIFHHANDASDLLNFRLVCKAWDTVSCTLLRQQNSCEIILKEEGTRSSTFCSRRPDKIPLNLRGLNALLSTSPSLDKFPCQSLKFLSGKLGSCPELEKLFQLYGFQVTEVTITRFCQLTPHFFQLLFQFTPNLQFLQVHSFSEVIDGCDDPNPVNKHHQQQQYRKPLPIVEFQSLDDKLIIFHELQTLEFDLPYSPKAEIILGSLLRSAVNLKIVRGLSMKFIGILCKLKKIHLIRELLFNPTDGNVHLFHQCSMEGPKLSKLHIKFGKIVPEQMKQTWSEVVTTSLNEILESSKWTLKFLDVGPLSLIPGIQIPTMRNVKCLILRDSRRCYSDLRMQLPLVPKAMFPPSTVFKQRFPNLSTVCLYLKDYDARSLNGFFPDDSYKNEDDSVIEINNPFSTVKNLDVDSFSPSYFGVRALTKKFPNLTNIRLACGDAFQLSNFIWDFPLSVESLELHGICVNASKPVTTPTTPTELAKSTLADVASWVDAFFTGIPQDVCKTFRRFPRSMKDGQLVELLREKSSICRLKNLRELKLFVQGWNSTFFTNVSNDYAFKKLPKLKVYFAHDHKKWNCIPIQECEKLLQEIGPYVNFISPTASQSFCSAHLPI